MFYGNCGLYLNKIQPRSISFNKKVHNIFEGRKKKDSVKVEVEMLSFPPAALTIYEYRTTIIYRLPLKYTLQTTFISFHLGILLKYNADAAQI